jgi:hypothetical protein
MSCVHGRDCDWLHMESVQAVPRSQLKAQSGEVPTLRRKYGTVYCVTWGITTEPRKLKAIQKWWAQKNSMKLEASWAYTCTTDGSYPVSPAL